MLKILSLGAGVQSTTVALMSAYGEIEKLDACVFADTGWEPQPVYKHPDKQENEDEHQQLGNRVLQSLGKGNRKQELPQARSHQ